MRAAAIYAERERQYAAGLLLPEMLPFFRRRTIYAAELGDSTAMVPREIAIMAEAELGTAWSVSPDSFLRWIIPGPNDARLPFHQDERIQSRRLINIWMPLDPCGVDAPGLELILSPARTLLPVTPPPSPTYAVEYAQISEADAMASGMPWRPVMDPGDALVFWGTTPHRTHIAPHMTKSRQSIEIRLVAS